MLAPSVSRTTHIIPVPTERIRLLLIVDTPERQQRMLETIDQFEYEAVLVHSLEELLPQLQESFDAILVEVDIFRLPQILKGIRSSEHCATVPILVEGSRLDRETALAGVLPTYRAMPCSYQEMFRLLNRRLDHPVARLTRSVL